MCSSTAGAQSGGAVPAAATPPAPAVARPAPPPVSVTGYLQLQYSNASDSNDDGSVAADTTALRRVRVKLTGTPVDRLSYALMFDPSTPGNMLRDAYVSLAHIPHHELRLGQQKTQFGYENPESSTRLYTIDRAVVSDKLGRGADLRDIGAGLLGDWKLGSGVGVDYQVTLVNGAGPNVTRDDTEGKNLWGRLGASWRDPGGALEVHVGVSGARGSQVGKGADPVDPADDFVYDLVRAGADLVVDHRWVRVMAEVLWGRDSSGGSDTDRMGGYLSVVGRTPWHAGPIARIEQYDANTDADGDRQRRYTVGAYYDVSGVNARLIGNLEIDDSQTAQDDQFLLWAQLKF